MESGCYEGRWCDILLLYINSEVCLGGLMLCGVVLVDDGGVWVYFYNFLILLVVVYYGFGMNLCKGLIFDFCFFWGIMFVGLGC